MWDFKALARLCVCFKKYKVLSHDLLQQNMTDLVAVEVLICLRAFQIFHSFAVCSNGVNKVVNMLVYVIRGHFFRSSSHPSIVEGSGMMTLSHLKCKR